MCRPPPYRVAECSDDSDGAGLGRSHRRCCNNAAGFVGDQSDGGTPGADPGRQSGVIAVRMQACGMWPATQRRVLVYFTCY